ncbi:MAG: hypothetical protein ABSB88_17060 [Bryobacteraceae bacterium]|jgi:hypothetical protein
MIKLYRSATHPKQWIAHVEGSGWVVFPAREKGWESRQAARGLDPVYLRQVPVSLAESAGLPEGEFRDAA